MGVPQGSLLSSLLFSLFINSLFHNNVFSEMFLYADDLKLLGMIFASCKKTSS